MCGGSVYEMLSGQLVPESTRTQVNSYPFWSTRTYFLVNSYGPSQLIPILVNSYPFWSTRTHFGQLVPSLVNSYPLLNTESWLTKNHLSSEIFPNSLGYSSLIYLSFIHSFNLSLFFLSCFRSFFRSNNVKVNPIMFLLIKSTRVKGYNTIFFSNLLYVKENFIYFLFIYIFIHLPNDVKDNPIMIFFY